MVANADYPFESPSSFVVSDADQPGRHPSRSAQFREQLEDLRVLVAG